MDTQRSAGADNPELRGKITVNVYAIGEPGYVKILAVNTGPEPFSREEAARALRRAADQLDTGVGWLDTTQPQ